jgi:multidrug resistance efflux pump
MKKQNNAAKIQEELQQKKVQLSTQLVADSLKRLQLRQKLDKQKKLLAMGGSSKELVEALTTELQLATLQIREKKASFLSFQRIAAINIENLKLEEQLKQQEVRTYQKQLNAAAITPKRRSLLLSLEGSTGQQVVGGTEIAQVAGLEDFDIRGTLNGQQADKIFQGQSAQVRVGSDTLQATVRSISPNIQNGSIGFTLGLIESTDTKLRHNMPVEIFLITNRLESVLVVPNRLLTGAESYQDVFRVKDKELLKQRVLIGGTSYQWAVIEEGLKEGDVIMNDLSQTQKYAKNQRLKWK